MFVWWKVAFIIGTIFSISYWGYIIDRYGAVKIIKVSAFFSPIFVIIPALFYNYYFILVIVSFLAGVILPGFMLSLTNYLYQNIKIDLINHVVFFSIFQSTAILLGTLFGSWLIFIGTRMFNTEFKAIIVVFIISGVVRIIGAFFSLRIKDKNKEDAHLFRSILLQRPVSYGVREFGHFLSYEEKRALLTFKSKQIAFNQLSKKEKQKILDKIKKEKKEIMDFILKVEENEKKILKRLKSSKKK
jgi:MFS family permease